MHSFEVEANDKDYSGMLSTRSKQKALSLGYLEPTRYCLCAEFGTVLRIYMSSPISMHGILKLYLVKKQPFFGTDDSAHEVSISGYET